MTRQMARRPNGLIARVEELMRRAAAESILPRFRALLKSDVKEKSFGDFVTAADRDAETLLTSGLESLLPGSRVLGEEAAAAQPDLLGRLRDEDRLWLVDPLDGTANFVAGDPCFAVMVALLERGHAVMGWILDPVGDVMAVAETKGGAFWGVQRITVRADAPPPGALRGAVLTRFLPPEVRDRVEARRNRFGAMLPGLRCAGREYPAVARGEEHFAVFWRTDPWDHAAGALFVTEAGGHVARLDGAAYRPMDGRSGLLVAHNSEIWRTVEHCLAD